MKSDGDMHIFLQPSQTWQLSPIIPASPGGGDTPQKMPELSASCPCYDVAGIPLVPAANSTAKTADPVSNPSQWLGFEMRVFVANYSTMDGYYHKTFSTINTCAASFVMV